MDPTGHIALFTGWQDRLKETRQELINSAQDFADFAGGYLPESLKPLQNRISRPMTDLVGGLAGVTGVADKALGVVNWATNAAVATVAPDSELGRQAGQETNELIESATAAHTSSLGRRSERGAQMVVEDPLGAAGVAMEMAESGANKAIDHAVALAKADPRATASTTAFTTELAADIVIGAKGAGAGRSLLQTAGRQVDELAAAAGRGLREGAEHLPFRYSPNPGANLGNLSRRAPSASSGATGAAAPEIRNDRREPPEGWAPGRTSHHSGRSSQGSAGLQPRTGTGPAAARPRD